MSCCVYVLRKTITKIINKWRCFKSQYIIENFYGFPFNDVKSESIVKESNVSSSVNTFKGPQIQWSSLADKHFSKNGARRKLNISRGVAQSVFFTEPRMFLWYVSQLCIVKHDRTSSKTRLVRLFKRVSVVQPGSYHPACRLWKRVLTLKELLLGFALFSTIFKWVFHRCPLLTHTSLYAMLPVEYFVIRVVGLIFITSHCVT